jgi:hypothetical protein
METREKLIILSLFCSMTFLLSWKSKIPLEFQDKSSIVIGNPDNVIVNSGQDAVFVASCSSNQSWQYSDDGGFSWEGVEDVYPYDIYGDTLRIYNTSIDMDGYLYRIKCCKKKEDHDDEDEEEDKTRQNNRNCNYSRFATLNVYLPLPIHLTQFQSTGTSEGNRLKWKGDEHFSYFIIERRSSDIEWNSIGKINYNIQNTYEFLDKNPEEGHNYYRIKGVFENEDFEYSKIAVIYFGRIAYNYKYLDIYGREVKSGLEPYKMYFRVSSNSREKVVIY